MTDTTPIPEGALTVDNAPGPEGDYYVRFARNASTIAAVSRTERARLLAHQPDRPTGVPDRLSISHELRAVLIEQADGWLACGTEKGNRIAADINALLAAVPTYQPDPDPADSPTGLVATPLTYTPPASGGERTGPLGLSEADTRKIAKQNESWVALAVGSGTLACKAWDAAQGACRAAVAEWDAEPQPAETLADIVAEMRALGAYHMGFDASALLTWAHRVEAASRPDPDTITVNLPRETAEWLANNYATGPYPGHMREAGRAAAAGLPQEPTEGGES